MRLIGRRQGLAGDIAWDVPAGPSSCFCVLQVGFLSALLRGPLLVFPSDLLHRFQSPRGSLLHLPNPVTTYVTSLWGR